MDTLINVAHGFGVALQPVNLIYCFIGVFIGTLVGVLPGIGPISAMSLLLPITLSGTPESGIIMMAGIYYGSMYGGSTTSILVNIPGEAASVVTCIDGHQMAKQGRAGPALGISAFGSFFAGTFSLVALMLVAPRLASVAIAFGPAQDARTAAEAQHVVIAEFGLADRASEFEPLRPFDLDRRYREETSGPGKSALAPIAACSSASWVAISASRSVSPVEVHGIDGDEIDQSPPWSISTRRSGSASRCECRIRQRSACANCPSCRRRATSPRPFR